MAVKGLIYNSNNSDIKYLTFFFPGLQWPIFSSNLAQSARYLITDIVS